MATLKLAEVLKDIEDSLAGVVKVAEADEKDKEDAEDKAPGKKEECPEDEKDKDEEDKDEDKEAADNSVAILAAIEAAVSETSKMATESNPTSDLVKLANDLHELEFGKLTKKAEVLGKAIADSVYTQLCAYEKAAQDLSAQARQESLDTAPERVKEAAEQGYSDMYTQMTKVAEDLFAAGYVKTASLLTHKFLFEKAAGITDQLIAALPQES